MSRKLRIEYPGAMYHVMNRGDQHEDIFWVRLASRPSGRSIFLAGEIIVLEKCKLDGRSSGFGVPYRFYVGIKTELLDFIE